MIKPNTPVVIWDIDGVLADDRVRAEAFVASTNQFDIVRGHTLRSDPDWVGYYGAMEDDEPFRDMVAIYGALCQKFQGEDPNDLSTPITAMTPVFLTGRPVEYRQQTVNWLQRHVDPFAGTEVAPLVMRRTGSTLSNVDEKESHMAYIRQQYGVPVMAFEDNDKAVEFYRSKGIRCLQPQRMTGRGAGK